MGDTAEAETAEEAPDSESGRAAELTELTGAVRALTEQVQAHHARAEARERVIDQLHAEVQRLRAGEQEIVLRPVVTDLQNLRTDLLRQSRTLPPDVGRDQIAGLLESFALTAELALERCGIVPVRPEIGAAFSAREHKAIKAVEAVHADEDGTIAEIVADGYQDIRTERILAAARVHVRRWTEPADEHQPEGSTDA
ncbi:nucleotide exchange factor GrpE [Amycolatopsis halotolerans]|uniref:Nucleotide exchange factor GrpE n=1 Tax=Amycolatopsis halotolerans TaxID=330083 RepID=A0ABV7QUX2_9PSEU